MARRLEYRRRRRRRAFGVTFEHRRDAYTLDLGAAGAYLRFTGDVTVEHGTPTRSATAHGQTLWELLYFGERRRAAPLPSAGRLIGHQA